MRRVVIAGAGLAGSRCAETLRAHGFDGDITVVGDESVPPYERPALSKEFLRGDKPADALHLRPPGFWAEQGIELLLGRRVVGARAGRAHTEDGMELGWDAFVVATGARPRMLPFATPPGVHVLRTLADAQALRARLRPGVRLAVVGAGFVGAEVASTARDLGAEVVVVEADSAPLARLLGDEVGAVLAGRFQSAGAELHASCDVVGFRVDGGGHTDALRLADGREISCDLVLVAVGAEPVRPSVDGPGIHVCGDAAGGAGHWTSAATGAAAVAAAILGLDPPPPQPPYFWSDQFGLRLQLVGDPRDATGVELVGRDADFVARYRNRNGVLVAALVANRPGAIAPLRRELALAA